MSGPSFDAKASGTAHSDPICAAMKRRERSKAPQHDIVKPSVEKKRHGVHILFIPDVIERTRLSRASIYRHSAQGLLPQIHHLGKRSFMYSDELDDSLLRLGEQKGDAG